MSMEGAPAGASERYEDAWVNNAAAASETLYPGLLEQLATLQPEGDRAVIKSMVRAEGLPTVSDGDIAKLWQLSKFDERAHDELAKMVEDGLCTHDDVAAVFFKMAELGLF